MTTDSGASPSLRQQVLTEAAQLAAQVEAAIDDQEKSRVFFEGIRKTCIPYLPCDLQQHPQELFARSYDAIFTLARTNLPLAVGFTMHQYNLASLATLPVPQAPEFENRRKVLVESIKRYRSLLAISSFGSNISNNSEADKNLVVAENERGEFVCNGRKNFQSMASQADLLLFSGYIDEEQNMGMFYCQLKDQPAITIGESLFAGAMSLTDTKPLFFENLTLKRRNMLSLEEWLTYHVSNYATSWFEALVTAAYLGGASRAIEEVRRFGRSVHVDDDQTLSELDGFVLESGRLVLKHRAALCLAQGFGAYTQRYCQAVVEGADEEVQEHYQAELMEAAGVIKHHATQAAQDVVNKARALIGTRSMSVSHPIHALTEQICFGPLHPIIPARHERETGEEVLGEEPYFGLFS